jgi:hypothetical protein
MALNDKQDKITLNSLASIRKVEDSFTLQLEKTMRKLERNLTDYLQANQLTGVVDTALSRQQIQQVLIDSGYYQTTGALLNEGYQAAINESANLYSQLYDESFQFQDVSLQQLNALKNLDLTQFNQLADTAAQTLNRTLTDLQFGAIDFNQALTTLREKVVDQLQRHGKTWLTTGLSGIYRESTTQLASDNGIERYQYVGPNDSLTRPFCKKYLGQVKTLDEWNKLDNGQINPVGTYGGGYNCRHTFIGVVDG